MKFFNRHLVLKSLVVVTFSLFVLVLAYFGGVWLEVTPHVALTYMTGGIIASWSASTMYDRIVMKKVDRQVYKNVASQSEDISKLKNDVRELQELNGTYKRPYTRRD